MSEEATERRSDGATKGASALPSAVLKPERRLSLAWIVPIVVLVLAIWLGWSAWKQRGVRVTVQLPEGHGLKVGDDVRYRGTTVGEVSDVTLAPDVKSVYVTASLHARADRLARAGSRFWVMRPQLRLSGVAGLETLLGPRYLAVLPGNEDGAGRGARQREFVGLAEPPVVERIGPGDLEVILEADRRGSLQRGAPVSFRQVRIGTVLSVGLASDSSAVEARLHIRKAYRELVREGTRFWDAGGVAANFSITGFSVELDSIEELLAGGVALATPPAEDAGATIHTGHRFHLHEEPDGDWLQWQTTVAVGSSLLPPGARLPQPLRAAIAWKQGFIIKGQRSRQGWVLRTPDGLLGPADLLTPGEDADEGTVTLEVGGREVALEAAPDWAERGLARISAEVGRTIWPDARTRAASEPEDCIAVADPAAAPLPLAATRLTESDGRWLVDGAVPVDESWHGACVLSRADGRLLGMLLIDDDEVSVALLPGE